MPPSSTVIAAVALLPSAVAVIVAVPRPTPTTVPEFETVAFAGSEVLHEKVRSRAEPEAVFAVAESWTVAAGTRVAVSREIVTDATVGAGGSTTFLPSPHDPTSQAKAMIRMQP